MLIRIWHAVPQYIPTRKILPDDDDSEPGFYAPNLNGQPRRSPYDMEAPEEPARKPPARPPHLRPSGQSLWNGPCLTEEGWEEWNGLVESAEKTGPNDCDVVRPGVRHRARGRSPKATGGKQTQGLSPDSGDTPDRRDERFGMVLSDLPETLVLTIAMSLARCQAPCASSVPRGHGWEADAGSVPILFGTNIADRRRRPGHQILTKS